MGQGGPQAQGADRQEKLHGTFSRYCHDACRCDDCRLANTLYHRALRKQLRARIGTGQARVPHGTAGGYGNHGCRCCSCRAAHHDSASARRRAANGVVARAASRIGGPRP